MGVKGLQAYTEQCCPGALVQVNLQQLAQQYRRLHGRQPVLIIDGMALLRKFYNPGIPWVYGGEWLELFERIRAFLETLRDADIKPVFIFDGVVEQSKRATWLDRRKKERRLVGQVFQHIKKTGQHPDKRLYHIPPCISGCMTKALKTLGAEMSKSSIEADKEIFHYYKKHQCFGVLSQDSDFLIFDIESYFSAESLDLRTLNVKMYNKQVLCRNLGLHPHLFPLLACILGNDTISQGSLTRFHHWVTRTPRDGRLRFQTTVPSCAEYLASFGIQSLSEKVTSELEQQVFRYAGMEGVFQQVVKDYTLEDDSQEVKPSHEQTTSSSSHPSSDRRREYVHPQSKKGREMLQVKHAPSARHHDILEVISKRKIKGAGFVKKVLRFAETDCNMSFEDDSDRNMPSAAVVLRPIRQRVYGVLFGIGSSVEVSRETTQAGHRSGSNLVVGVNAVHEYYAYAGNPLKDPDVVAAIPLDLPGGTPTLEDLWTKPEEETLHLRQQAVLSCLHCRIDHTLLLQTLPRHYVALCCLIHFFVQNGPESMMRESDVDAFVAQAVCLGLHTAKSIWDMRVPRVDPRGVHLATIFMRGLNTFWEANAACAEPFKMEDSLPWQCFDGKLFNVKYLMAQDGAPIRALCQENGGALQYMLQRVTLILDATVMQQTFEREHENAAADITPAEVPPGIVHDTSNGGLSVVEEMYNRGNKNGETVATAIKCVRQCLPDKP